MEKFGIREARDSAYGCAAALSYWVFRCRDKSRSPAMGTGTWTFFESSIQNSAEISTTIEDYLQNLCDKLLAHLRPKELIWVVQPNQIIVRVANTGEIQEMKADQDLALYSWQEMIQAIAPDGFNEWDVLELCRTKAAIIQVLCRLRFEQDRALGKAEIAEETTIEATVNV
jgi:hypothetical protein